LTLVREACRSPSPQATVNSAPIIHEIVVVRVVPGVRSRCLVCRVVNGSAGIVCAASAFLHGVSSTARQARAPFARACEVSCDASCKSEMHTLRSSASAGGLRRTSLGTAYAGGEGKVTFAERLIRKLVVVGDVPNQPTPLPPRHVSQAWAQLLSGFGS
jgi:hypothetical protein